ncbi:MAG: hypothetical protein ACJ749_03835 [Flavisolibacter sp.]
MTPEQIYTALPSTWADVKLKQFVKLTDLTVDPLSEKDDYEKLAASLQKTYHMVSILSGATIEEVINSPKMWLDKMGQKVAFMDIKPIPKKDSKFKWKTVDEITYNDLVTYILLKENFFDHVPTIVKTFSKVELTEDEIWEAGMDELHTGFFLLLNEVKTFLTHTEQSLKALLKKQKKAEKKLNLSHGKMNSDK